MRILHLSDPHATASGYDEDGVASTEALERMLHDCRHVPDLDLVVVSGDIADDGSVEGCEAVRDRVGAYAAARGIPVVYCTGNHDARDSFEKVLGSGHRGVEGEDAGRLGVPDTGERAAVSTVRGVRVITLDSLVPGETPGRVSAEQLAWLRHELTTPAAAGSIVVLHHPPVHPRTHPHLARVGLLNGDDLSAAIADTDVRAVLAGHFHLQLMGRLGGARGVPVWVTPGIVTRIDLTTPPGLERAVTGAGASVVDLDAGTFHTLQARDPQAGRVVWTDDPADEPAT